MPFQGGPPSAYTRAVAQPSEVRLAELVATLSLGTDLGLGQPWEAVIHVREAPTRILAVAVVLFFASCSSPGGLERASPPLSAMTGGMTSPVQQLETGSVSAKLGVHYFGGWSGSLGNDHFAGLPSGPYEDRQPLYGWLDNSKATMLTQLYWARRMGIGFFNFLWYDRAETIPGEDPYLNQALGRYLALEDHQDVDFAITYTNHEPFGVPPDRWHEVIEG